MHENPTIDRAIVLLETQRYADAEKILRQGLTQHPQDALALTLLAICQLHLDKKKDALTTMEQAVSLAPDEPFVLTTHGRILWHNNQMDAARQSLRSALQLDPTFSEAYSVITQIEYQQRNWQVALLNAEQGLEHDPENQALINFRAMALVKLKRSSEASETLDYALYNDPEDSFSHSNKGWVKLEQGHYGEAVASFKEALRFNPNSEHAREGLKEAIKGKNWLYRGILRYFLFMSKLSERNQWLVIIGLYIGVRFLRVIVQENSALRPFIAPILILYMVFVFATWIGQPLSNLILRLHPVGKFALTDDEKRFSNIVGTFLLFGLLAIVGSYWMADENLSTKLSILGITCFAMLIPIGGVSNMPEKSQARRWLGIYAVVMFVIGPLVQLLNAFVLEIPVSGALLGVFGLGVFLYGWVANIVASRAAMRM